MGSEFNPEKTAVAEHVAEPEGTPAGEPSVEMASLNGPAGWTERRAARRFPLRLPVFVTVTEGGLKDHPTVTRDVSASGVFFEMENAIPVGTEIEFTLTLPPEITHSESIRVHCLGTVVRAEHGERAGVAALIDEFDLLA